jgi:23S rRNA G2069 N7-methylase RlmK/C1962 C5-methylase RlmI
MQSAVIEKLLERALQARAGLLPWDEPGSTPVSALRLFNGFLEGSPNLVAELYGRTLVLFNYAEQPEDGQPIIQAAQHFFLEQLPWLRAVVVKTRHAALEQERRGVLVYGQSPAQSARARRLVRARSDAQPGCQPVSGYARPARLGAGEPARISAF